MNGLITIANVTPRVGCRLIVKWAPGGEIFRGRDDAGLERFRSTLHRYTGSL